MQKKRIVTMVVLSLVVFAFIAGPMVASADDKKVTRKMLLGGRLGDSWFVLSQALAYFVNMRGPGRADPARRDLIRCEISDLES